MPKASIFPESAEALGAPVDVTPGGRGVASTDVSAGGVRRLSGGRDPERRLEVALDPAPRSALDAGRSVRISPLPAIAVAILTWALLACGESSELPPTVHTPRVAGVVVDEKTGKPVENAEVFLERTACCVNYHANVGFPLRSIWTTTDDAGRFEFPAWSFEVEGKREGYRLNDGIAMFVVHPDYGSPVVGAPEDPAQWESIRLEIERSLSTWEAMQDPTGYATVCMPLTGDAFHRCCEVTYGEDNLCGSGRRR